MKNFSLMYIYMVALLVSACGDGGGNGAGGSADTTLSRLNDSGVTTSQCYQAGDDSLVACSSAGAMALSNAQDGMQGRDVIAAVDGSADGKLGFSFATVAGGCVQDNVTGLMWEVKTNDGGLRDLAKTYTNYSAAYNPSGLYGAATDASGFVAAVNATNLCGYNDWRLPTADELQSIVDYGVAYPGPTIDAAWFPNTHAGRFWSETRSVANPNAAWIVYFDWGHVTGGLRDSGYYVRLVRGGAAAPDERYAISADGAEVTDHKTGLIWQRCSEGMNWNGATCAGTASTFTHEAALQRAAALASSTGAAWRLPNVKELASIADKNLQSSAIDSAAFPATPNIMFWTATPVVVDSSYAWHVGFNAGNVSDDLRSSTNCVRLVRSSE